MIPFQFKYYIVYKNNIFIINEKKIKLNTFVKINVIKNRIFNITQNLKNVPFCDLKNKKDF